MVSRAEKSMASDGCLSTPRGGAMSDSSERAGGRYSLPYSGSHTEQHVAESLSMVQHGSTVRRTQRRAWT